MPFMALLTSSLVPAMGVPLTLETLSFDAYRTILSEQSVTFRAMQNSLLLSIGAALTLICITMPLAYLSEKQPGKITRSIVRLIDIPFTLPGVVLSIACILMFARPLPLIGISLYGTLGIIFVAYIARFMSVSFKPIHNSMKQLDPSLEEAAELAGASLWQRLIHIVFPLLLPSAFAGGLLVFLNAVNELTVSALLWSAGNETLGVIVFSG
ncbi:ferric iron ABC transporter permease protein [Vibrio variabilis]|uniref:Ferric iron ABC transporter permease protein n=1 Tax=Vibrio variabilis TaxID=990271 RepID=A0ABQ0JHI5_9VIBR|nr:ferric iron ABC transporter permease protein [Vibrio variabilis]